MIAPLLSLMSVTKFDMPPIGLVLEFKVWLITYLDYQNLDCRGAFCSLSHHLQPVAVALIHLQSCYLISCQP